MSASPVSGGPAFPSLNAEFTGISSEGQERYEVQPSGGMTLLDYFAAKAMQAALINADIGEQIAEAMKVDKAGEGGQVLARAAYAIADAMLAAREGATHEG